ncbi:MAG: hypothetical protein E6H06_15530 [Bacteroidetes bacterium]|nr:MAG: hypothetical protein E6H06_15530 [Bacteroidota bacterium]
MKNVKFLSTAFALLSICLTLTRCTPDTTGIKPSTEDVLIRNTWAIDYYYHNQDMTNSFGSSKILFSNSGAVGYLKDGLTVAGTWNNSVDASNNELITLQFNTTDANIIQLNKSWRLTDRTSSSLQFVETDGTTNILFRIKTQ